MSQTNPAALSQVITSPTLRRWIYSVYLVGTVVAGAFQVGYASLEQPTPDWLSVALDVLVFLSVPVGGLALVHTPKVDPPLVPVATTTKTETTTTPTSETVTEVTTTEPVKTEL